ncbi:MAG: flagellar hook-basal body complex protein FliE [Bdellovibrionales bacterium]|nr:flagellar hook-basal body complex protein FliE [Bdellovibrionales bacterium]
MSNLTIENLAGTLQSGNVDGFLGAGKQNVSAPEAPTLRAMQAEGMATPDVSSAGEAAKGFGQMLTESLEKVNEAQISADKSIKELAAGRTKNIHETMLQIENADASLKLMMQVRNKVLDAYKEIMRMQV